MPYFAYVDGLMEIDMYSDSWDFIDGETLNAEDYDIDNNAIVIDNDPERKQN